MKAIVTFGPSQEPIDQVRSLTNHSTGELGALLVEALIKKGVEVVALRSRTATYPLQVSQEKLLRYYPFKTSQELFFLLEKLAFEEEQKGIKTDFFFHVAALSDYRIVAVSDPQTGENLVGSFQKIPTRRNNSGSSQEEGNLLLELAPAPKLIAHLRHWFPETFLVGWKYELEGTPEQVRQKCLEQIEVYQLDASVANGSAMQGKYELLLAPRLVQSVVNQRKSFDSKEGCVKGLVASFIDSSVVSK